MNTANLRRLLDEATARPWKAGSFLGGGGIVNHVAPNGDVLAHIANCYSIRATRDAALIVELVNNADELLAENERLRADVTMLREENDNLAGEINALERNQ